MIMAKSGAKPMMRRFNIFKEQSQVVVFVCVVALFHHTADAAQTQIFSGPVTSAMGGSGRAGAETTEVMFLNPTAVAVGKPGMEAGLLYSDGYWANGEHETGMAVSLVENDPTNFAPGGFAYVQKRNTLNGLGWSERYFFGALAKTVSPLFTLGLSVYHLQQELDGGTKHSHWNGALGALFTVSPGLGIAYVLSNPIKANNDVPEPLRPIMQQSLGLHWLIEDLMRVTFDVTRWEKYNADKKAILQSGFEIRLAEFAVGRLGLEIDDIRKRNAGTLGFGFMGPRLKANYSFYKPLTEMGRAMHSVDLQLPF